MKILIFGNRGIIFLAFLLVILSSCESGGIFRSKKRIDRLLQGTWERQNFRQGEEDVRWEFRNGTLIRTVLTEENGESTWELSKEGDYEVDAGFSRAFINIRNFDLDGIDLSGKWQIYDIDKSTMIIFTKDLGGTVTREFVKSESQ